MRIQTSNFVLMTVIITAFMCIFVLFDVQGSSAGARYDGSQIPSMQSVDSLMGSIRPTKSASLISLLFTIGLAFLIPPLPFIHQWLLAQVYRYAFQPGEKSEWVYLSRVVTGIITICAAVAIALWYLDARVTFSRIWGIMTLVCLVLGIGGGVWIANTRQFSRRFTVLMALGAGLVSLLIPAGVVGVYLIWPVVLAGIIGYRFTRILIESRLEREYAALTYWQIDSITLGGMAIAAVFFVFFLPLGASLIARVSSNGSGLLFLYGVGLLAIFSIFMGEVTRFHLRGFAGKKKNADADTLSTRFLWSWVAVPIVWTILGVSGGFGIFYAQMFAYSIFSGLARL